jgi:hypothetical protein
VSIAHTTSSGLYCITLDPSISVAGTNILAVPDYALDNTSSPGPNTSADKAQVETRSNAVDCTSPSTELEIRTFQQEFTTSGITGNLVSDEGFFFIVP